MARDVQPRSGLAETIKNVLKKSKTAARVAGALARGIEFLGRTTPTTFIKINPLDPTAWITAALSTAVHAAPEFGLTETVKHAAGTAIREKASEEGDVETIKKLEDETFRQTGRHSAIGADIQKLSQSGGDGLSGKEFTADSLKVLGVNPDIPSGSVVTIGGKQYKMVDTGKGTRRLEAYTPPPPPSRRVSVDQVKRELQSKANLLGVEVGDEDVLKVMEDVRNRKLSLAQAIENHLREAAERKWQAFKETLAEQRRLAEELAASQKEEALEQEKFYKSQIERRKQKELRNIEKMKEAEEKTFLEEKDQLGAAFAETINRLQQKLRGLGVAQSGFATAEERKLLSDFNRNLAKLTLKHRDIVQSLNEAMKDTVETYDEKIAELELQTRSIIRGINNWLRQQITTIQNAERMSLAQKFEEIAKAIATADSIRIQVENAYAQQKLDWAKWVKNLQVQMALSAKYAAENKISSAKKAASDLRKEVDAALKKAMVEFEPTEDGKYVWYYYSPTQGGYVKVGEIDENTRNAMALWMQKQILPQNQALQGMLEGSLPPQTLPTSQLEQQQQEQGGGLTGFIKNLLGRNK